MPIFGISEEVNLNVEEKQNKSIVPMFETERTNEEIRAYIAGYKWEVTYFHRNIDENTYVTEYDPELSPALQSYNRIDNFIINVETPLDSELSSGSGIVDLNEAVNPNDLFIAKIADGKSVIFVITNVRKVDYNNDKVYNVDYEVYGEITGLDDPQLTTLLNSTANEFVFNKDYRKTKTQPLYTKTEVKDKRELYKVMEDLISEWSRKFINQDTNFFMCYKDELSLVYDPQLETFIRDTIGLNNISNRIETVEVVDVKISILDLLVKQDIGRGRVHKYTSELDRTDVSNNPHLFTIDYIQVDDIIDVSRDAVYEETNNIINQYFPELETEHYIFRKQVYDIIFNPTLPLEYGDLTMFEQLLIATMSGGTIDRAMIDTLYEKIFDIGDKEQYYFMPILTYIIKYYLSTFTIEFI